MSAFLDGTYEKWVRWLDEHIVGEITQLHHVRALWQGFMQMVQQAAPDAPAVFAEAITHNYLHAQAIAVRREAEIDEDVVSVARLVDEIRRHPEVITRERWVGLWPIEQTGDPIRSELTRMVANRSFDKIAGPGADRFSAEAAEADLTALCDATDSIVKYAERVVAHSDRRPPRSSPTLADLDNALDVLGATLQRYELVVRASDRPFIAPVIQDDWRAPFRQPLA